ncbi:MAG: hypothetical protein ACFFDQ_06240 [Candidatus Thorarchaeota archaeon]
MLGTSEDDFVISRTTLVDISIAGLLLVFFLFTPNIYRAEPYMPNSTVVTLTQVNTTGSIGQTIAKESMSPINVAYLLNETPSPDSSSWIYDWNSYWPNPLKVETMMNEQGLVLDLASVEYRLSNGINVPLDDYDSLQFSAYFSLLSGEASARLQVGYTDYYGIDLNHLDHQQLATLNSQNSSARLSIDAPLVTLGAQVSHWLVHAYVLVEISTRSTARIVLHNVSVKATSSQDLFRLRIDVQSINGSSLYANPYFKWCRDYPQLNLTRQGSPDEWAVFPIARPNDTLYLAPCNISGYGGWRIDFYRDDCVPVNLTLNNGDDVVWGIRLFSTRLYLSINPHLPALYVDVGGYSFENPYERLAYDPAVSEFLYLPLPDHEKSVSFTVSLSSSYQYHFGFRYFSMDAYWYGLMDSLSDWNLDVVFPVIGLGPVAITSADVVVLINIILLGAFLIARVAIYFRKLGRSNVIRDPRIIPFILLCVSSVCPWATYTQSFVHWSGPESTVTFVRYTPLATYLESSAGSMTLIDPGLAAVMYDIIAMGLVGAAFILFWFPLLVGLSRIAVSVEQRVDPFFLIVLVLPILLVLTTFVPGFYVETVTLELGSYLALLAFPLWLILEAVQKRR